jgi:hypothetical protein
MILNSGCMMGTVITSLQLARLYNEQDSVSSFFWEFDHYFWYGHYILTLPADLRIISLITLIRHEGGCL